MDTSESRKARGAFFTPPEIANYLAGWAVRSRDDTVFEPSCGEASLLLAAAGRLKGMGASPSSWSEQIHGIEIFEASARNAEDLLFRSGFDARVAVGNFFEYDTPAVYDAVIGNPPFVRYQKFRGGARSLGLQAALSEGVRLPGLANAWAAFVVKAALHLAPEGRLALVLPAELLSVNYAREIRRFLLRRFARIRLVVFEERIFPNVLEEVVLLLAEGRGGADEIGVHQTRNVETLLSDGEEKWTAYSPRDGEKWTAALVSKEVFSTYGRLVDERFEPMEAWGSIYLGAVTGNNGFFSLTAADIRAKGLGDGDTVRIAPPGARYLQGCSFTGDAWRRLAESGARCFLLYPDGEPSPAAGRYIAEAEACGVSDAYKCRARRPWWRVPIVREPDLFLTYMNHDGPRLVSNLARVHIVNSVYGVRLAPGRRRVGSATLPVAVLNSVTLLGAEIVGRSYGGGLLKMEPREADRLPVPSLRRIDEVLDEMNEAAPRLAELLRRRESAAAIEAVDGIVLRGVPDSDLHAIRAARRSLYRRRLARGKKWKG